MTEYILNNNHQKQEMRMTMKHELQTSTLYWPYLKRYSVKSPTSSFDTTYHTPHAAQTPHKSIYYVNTVKQFGMHSYLSQV